MYLLSTAAFHIEVKLIVLIDFQWLSSPNYNSLYTQSGEGDSNIFFFFFFPLVRSLYIQDTAYIVISRSLYNHFQHYHWLNRTIIEMSNHYLPINHYTSFPVWSRYYL